jgi:hypothetical protein
MILAIPVIPVSFVSASSNAVWRKEFPPFALLRRFRIKLLFLRSPCPVYSSEDHLAFIGTSADH